MKPSNYYFLVFASLGALLISIYIYRHGSEIHRIFAALEFFGSFALIEAYYLDKRGEIYQFKGDIFILGYRYAGRISRKDDAKRVDRAICIQKCVGIFLFVLGVGLHVLIR